MNQHTEPELDAFESALLTELKGVVGQAESLPHAPLRSVPASRWWQRPRWQVVTAAAAAALAVVLLGPAVAPTPAYAVTGRNDRLVTVKVNRLEGADGLEQALRERGIPAEVTYLPPDKQCAPDRYADADPPGMSLSVSADRFEVRIPANAVGRGDTFVLSASVVPLPNGVRASVQYGIAHGPVASCRVVDAP